MNIKTKEASSLLVAVLAAAIVALATALAQCGVVGRFVRGGRDVPDRGAVRPLCDPLNMWLTS